MTEINRTAKAVMKEEALSKANSSAEKKLEMMVNEKYGKLTSNMCILFHCLFIKHVQERQC